MGSTIQPYQFVALRLPSDAIKVEQITPNALINLGKYGSFHTNQIIGRPFHLTFEILDRSESVDGRELRVVPAAELHADTLIEQSETPGLVEDGATPTADSEDPAPGAGKSNVNITDDPLNQKLTMAEIEALKQDETGSSRDLIAKIMASHSTLDQKTAFSLAKYTLRKNKKYMRRFCVLPLDVPTMTDWMMNERDFSKVLEIRNETIGLMGCWANVHASGTDMRADINPAPSCRYLVVDDTGGLVVAALAERMGILQPPEQGESMDPTADGGDGADDDEPLDSIDVPTPRKSTPRRSAASAAQSTTLTLIHANTQPNLSLLRYFSFDPNNLTPTHPLTAHLSTLSWLQLLDPSSDPSYAEPDIVPPEILQTYKSSKRGTYHRKRRRWERTRQIIDTTRAGGFNGLIIASHTSPIPILRHLIPLLAGGAQVVAYSPHPEPLVELVDLYSTARRTAFINLSPSEREAASEDFPLDPTLLLSPMLQTARVRRWQVLPGRTHPLMTGRGGGEGYIFVGTRVVPAEGKVEARGRAPRRKKRVDGAHEAGVGEEREGKRFKVERDEPVDGGLDADALRTEDVDLQIDDGE